MTAAVVTHRRNTRSASPSHDRVYFDGWMLTLIVFLFFTSGVRNLRVDFAGFAMPLFLMVAAPFFFARVLPKLKWRDVSPIAPMIGFTAFYAMTSFPSKSALVELIKIGTSIILFLTVQTSLKTRRELCYVSMAFAVGMGILAYRGIQAGSLGTLVGINPMSGVANKNAFGPYAVPAIAVSALVLLGHVKARMWQRVVTLVASLLIVAAIFSTASRSSWILVMLVAGFWVAQNRSPKTILLIVFASCTTYYTMTEVTQVSVVEHRLDATREGSDSDEARKDLVWAGFEIGLDHPLVGIGIDETYVELARRVKVGHVVNAHNVYAHIAASSGMVGLAAYLFAIFALYWRSREGLSKPARQVFLIAISIYLLEGMFTHEILYIPSLWFAMGLGARLCTARK